MSNNWDELLETIGLADTSIGSDVREHNLFTAAGEMVTAREIVTHYSDRPDTVAYSVAVAARGIGRPAQSYEEACSIVKHYVDRANSGATVAELDSII